jgi:hypothetical protein
MPRAKPLIDIKWSPSQKGYKGSTEALKPMRTVPPTAVLTKARFVPAPPATISLGSKPPIKMVSD